ncbi:carbon-nitrogen hydrolase family protein [Campylobacter concisus]|uniref:carbon-nitrogen hydrolase family protein n=1 Tax=Campylobacter concisus TaxID=199 RepID=UPI000CD9CEB5|nr:carbon-nitrogen hydrolase family protein [Campylobacter concisus]
MSKICALQLPTQPLSEARLDYYLKICADENARLVVLGEYVLNSFFKELASMPKSLIKEQSERKKEALFAMAKKYDLNIIAPIINLKGKEIFKSLAKFSPTQVKLYDQQILMPYAHWNEAKFFSNTSEELNLPIFTYDKFKVGVMFGFEAHFDVCWAYMSAKKVDIVLVPTACTFFSQARWEELLKVRAFTNNLYVLRVNRVGSHKSEDEQWSFYGDSMLISPFGEVKNRLGKNEEMMIDELSKKELSEARSTWGFMQIEAKFKR